MLATEIVRNVAAHLDDGDEIPMATFSSAIPFFLVRLTTICVERRELGVFREFILRAIQTCWTTLPEIAGFLGVRLEDVQVEIEELSRELFVSVNATSHKISLMEKGLQAISLIGLTCPTIRETACVVNGITRRIDLNSDEMLPRRKIEGDTLVLPSIPARAPRADELDLNGVKSAILSSRSTVHRVVEVARIGRVLRTNNLYVVGHLFLRRGAHTMPIVCVNGSVDTELALHIGAHPALQSVKAAVSRHEQAVKRTFYQRRAALRSIGNPQARNVLVALASLVLFADSTEASKDRALQEFMDASNSILKEAHWIGLPEAQMLLMRALSSVRSTLIIVLPLDTKTLLDIDVIEALQGVADRGVKVEIHVALEDERFFPSRTSARRKLRGVAFVPLNSESTWCGFCWDSKSAVVGATKSIGSTMGRCETFFGMVLPNDPQAKELLFALTLPAVIPVTIKKKKLKFDGALATKKLRETK
jgi:hypothetical protein